ncbi:MAG: zinc-ribbon domain-containing protein [Candidatus Pacearchaeota archaeon]|nr:zinc-ribbon domain-containing protein [Candidatus Pacearchaeota archaeon]
MFKKKECNKCGEKLSDKYDFCPYCGNRIKEGINNEWGMLGKNDLMSQMDDIKLPLGFKTLFNALMKDMNKQFNQSEKEMKDETPQNKIKKDGISISISTFGDGPPRISVNPLGNRQEVEVEKEDSRVKQSLFSKEKIKKFSSLPRKEPKTNIRRLSNKVIYELEMPEVVSIEDVSVVKLESSIEIKAIAKDKSYFKLIPINLPLKKCDLSEGKLILELGVK